MQASGLAGGSAPFLGALIAILQHHRSGVRQLAGEQM
jgi:hypothetical protein